MKRNILILLVTVYLTLVKCESIKCLKQEEGKHLNVLGLNKLIIEYNNPGVQFTWQAVRGTTNVTYWSNGMQMQVSENRTTGEVKIEQIKQIKQQKKPKETKGVSLGTTIKAFPGVLLCCAVVFHFTSDSRKISQLFLILGLASFGFCQIEDDCPKNFYHVQIPTAHIKELCINGVCRSTLCPLSPDSEFSHIPSNNKIIFSDEYCTIKKPNLWDEWLVHYFGQNSGQDYFGDIDGDDLVNLLEYYGKCAFVNNFVAVGGIQQSETSVNDSCQAVDVDLHSVLAQGCDPTNADTDGDLLPDGQERYYNTDPNVKNSIVDDMDHDGLNNLDEVIQKTDPR